MYSKPDMMLKILYLRLSAADGGRPHDGCLTNANCAPPSEIRQRKPPSARSPRHMAGPRVPGGLGRSHVRIWCDRASGQECRF